MTEALVQQFHDEMSTFHLSCEVYAVLPLGWKAILGLRFGKELVPAELVSFWASLIPY